MKKTTLLLFALLTLCAYALDAHAQEILPDPMPGGATSAGYYYENRGQIIDDAGEDRTDIRYYSEKGRARLFFAADRVHHTLRIPGDSVGGTLAPDTDVRLDVRFDCMNWQGDEGTPCATMEVMDESQDFLNYFLPHCGPAGITDVKGYKTVAYINAFPDIDVRYTADAGGPVMYFVIHPGADPADIRLAMEGQDQLIELLGGELEAVLAQQSILFPRGTVYQIDGSGNPYPIPSWYAEWNLIDPTTVGLTTGAYNVNDALVIKIARPPVVASTTAAGQDWGTYYDAANISDGGANIAVETSYTGTGTPPDADVAVYTVQDQQGTSSAFSPDSMVCKTHRLDSATFTSPNLTEDMSGSGPPIMAEVDKNSRAVLP